MIINWQQLVLNLRGYRSISTISRILCVSADHLERLSRGEVKQPKFETGMKLLDLHFEKVPHLHTQENICL